MTKAIAIHLEGSMNVSNNITAIHEEKSGHRLECRDTSSGHHECEFQAIHPIVVRYFSF